MGAGQATPVPRIEGSGGVGAKTGYHHPMTQDRLIQLEETAAHLARLIEDLSDIIARQDAEIRALTRKVDFLSKREAERAMDAEGGVYIADQKPPHW